MSSEPAAVVIDPTQDDLDDLPEPVEDDPTDEEPKVPRSPPFSSSAGMCKDRLRIAGARQERSAAQHFELAVDL